MQAPGCRGAALPIIDVTIPGRASFLDGISVCFSLMPLFLGLLTALGMFIMRRLSMFCAVFFWLALLVACEMLKGMVPGERPFGSCAVSSGHGPTVVITAYAFLAWLVLEMTFHQPQILKLYRLGYMIAACMLLGPIPAARARLRDHTGLQLGIGIVIGLAAGIVWFLLMKFVIGGHVLRWIGLLKARVKCLQFVNLQNDYFATREDYEEQQRRYREGGIKAAGDKDVEEEMGEMDPAVNEAEHEAARADIFGDGADDAFSDASTVSDLENVFGKRPATSGAGDGEEDLAFAADGSFSINSKQKQKNKKKVGIRDDGDGISPQSDSNSRSGGRAAAESPLLPYVTSPLPPPNNGSNTNTHRHSPSGGGETVSGTSPPEEGEEEDPSSSNNHNTRNKRSNNHNTTAAAASKGRGGGGGAAPSPTKSAMKASTSYGAYSPRGDGGASGNESGGGGGGGGEGYDSELDRSMARRRGGDADESGTTSPTLGGGGGRPGVRAGFVAFEDA